MSVFSDFADVFIDFTNGFPVTVAVSTFWPSVDEPLPEAAPALDTPALRRRRRRYTPPPREPAPTPSWWPHPTPAARPAWPVQLRAFSRA